ncbi:MAG: TonB-dependent receptor, partial [Gallionella sp.]
TVDWAYLPFTIDDIERIEVIRGPAATSYGANSTQGVINIITRDASDMDRKTVKVTHGTKGINDGSAYFGQRGEKFDYRMTLGYTADNGYDNLTTPPNNIPNAAPLLNNSYDNNQARLVNYRGNYHPNGRDNVDVQLGFNHDVQEVGFTDKNPSPANPSSTNGDPPHDLFGNSSFMQIWWTRILENSSELNLRYSHTQEDQHENLPVYLSGVYFPGPVVQTLNVVRDQIEIQHTISTSESNRLVYGANGQRNVVNGQSNIPPMSLYLSSALAFENFQIFANDEWRINPQFLLNVGDMLEKDDVGDEYSSPHASLNFHVTPEQTIRTGISVAYRTPALTETNIPTIQPGALNIPNATVNSPGLVPEKLVSHEIGYIVEFPHWRTLVDFRLYMDQLSNGIIPNTTAGVFENGFSAEYRGFEATLKKSWAETSSLTVNFAHAFASSNGPALFAAGNAYLAPNNPSSNDNLAASIPTNSASLLYALHFASDYSFNISYYYQDSLQSLDRTPIDFQPAQHRTDIRIARTFHGASGMTGNVALVVQNLFNTDYTEYIASNVFKRLSYATFTIDF